MPPKKSDKAAKYSASSAQESQSSSQSPSPVLKKTTKLTSFKPLYSLKETGKISKWSMFIEKVAEGEYHNYAVYGQVDNNGKPTGKMTKSAVQVIDKGNQLFKTAYDRAYNMALKKWTDKTNKGAKTDLANITAIKDTIQNDKSQILKIDHKNSTMLAHEYKPEKSQISFPCRAQPKLDGLRGRLTNGELFTRNGKKYNNFDDVTEEAKTLIKNFLPQSVSADSFTLDGELFTTLIPFEEISGLCRKKTVDDKARERLKLIKYHIFDCYSPENPTLAFNERSEILSQMFEKARVYEKKNNTKSYARLELVPTITINDNNDVIKRHNQYVKDGYEGIMLRRGSSPYQFKRCNDLLKFKMFKDEEFPICGFEEGTGTFKGTVIWKCKNKEGTVFNVTPSGDLGERAQLLKDAKKYIGKPLTVKYQELTNKGIPRFPIGKSIRYDI